MDSTKQNRKRKRMKLTCLVCNRSFDDDWMCFFYIYTIILRIYFIYFKNKLSHYSDFIVVHHLKMNTVRFDHALPTR
jgi:hypothetical protein